MSQDARVRAQAFAERFGLRTPILLAPMAGACPVALSVAVADGGGMGACGALLMSAGQITEWVREFRALSRGPFQLNTWIPDRDPVRDRHHEAEIRRFLAQWGPEVPETGGDARPPDFSGQCEAMLAAGPAVISSIMGLYPPAFVSRMKAKRIKWFATVTTVAEAVRAEQAGADAVIAQGMEAGGHRGAFRADAASEKMVGLFSLLPAVKDAVAIPVIAAGGVADARGVAAALILGASAVQIGTGFLRTPEAKLSAVWADAIGASNPEGTVATRAFSGRLGRSIRTKYAVAANARQAPEPAPYPVQRHLTQAMRGDAVKSGTLDGMQAWAGQSGRLARTASAKNIVSELWQGAQDILN
ncbi:NAD(P)H-dependent flavin oxidoreductase [Eilatimonas milleporae]|uniref:Propionate 3-nitronate monooxygenase n=1 Tax=Eilatimonas milleporae TaxID=911205 RepID=A0A3M0D690_9PROT|nr:nitronate monooxygenase [Eilatimonas milleporae]RMB11793.1 nitronate monooxygenase [Eilatimonas milleporae]